jgi:hypothetical protein
MWTYSTLGACEMQQAEDAAPVASTCRVCGSTLYLAHPIDMRRITFEGWATRVTALGGMGRNR